MSTQCICNTCGYPSRLEAACDNPGCTANRGVTDEQKAIWRATAEKKRAEQAAWDASRALKRRAGGW